MRGILCDRATRRVRRIAGASERSIMNQTVHGSVQTVRRYIRDGSLFREKQRGEVGVIGSLPHFEAIRTKTSTDVEVLITVPDDLSAPSATIALSVCVFVSVRLLPSGEKTKRLTSLRLWSGISRALTMSKVKSSMRRKDRDTGPMTVAVPSSFRRLSACWDP